MSALKYTVVINLVSALFMSAATFNAAKAQPDPQRVLYVIDSVPIKRGFPYYLKPKNLETVRVAKGQFRDTVAITLKDHVAFIKLRNSRFLSPDDIAKKYIPGYNSSSQVLFIWNDKLLVDTAEVGVPIQYFKKAEVVNSSKTSYAKMLPKAVILKIYVVAP
ncbi:hypothetical protein [Mucilaginibacter ginkgonis]|uniref:Uncharacterized protein n=1 Tax=Mucilaginibacter ginkgonis TaxID=2682091 RepID=A0A6I4I3K7_9SPHI|nr:hypothetical protein [Mucilaginibacter ginkgonis]QQL48630.1 hypothetical protein GO620_010595 [Mucilaginibacter ginkgonis]